MSDFKTFFFIFISKVSTKSLVRTNNRIRGSSHSSKKTLISKIRSFKFIVSLMFVSLLLANSYQIILPEIIISVSNNTPIEYIYTKNTTDDVYNTVDKIYSFLILCLLNILIVIFNVITLIKTQSRLKSKRAMTNNNASAIPLTGRNERPSQDLAVRARKKISKAEINISLMVFTSGIVEIFGSILPFIYILNTSYEDTNACLITFFYFLAEISYTLSFFIYFSFDMNFRKCFFSFFLSAWNWFHSNSNIENDQNQ